MPLELWLETKPYGFAPVTLHDWEQHAVLTMGSRVRAQLTRSKSRDMNAFFWALVSFAAKGIGYQKEPLATELLIRTGHVHALTFRDGSVHAVPASIAKMDHATFKAFVDAAIELLLAEYLTMMRRDDLLREIERMVGIRYTDINKKEPGDGSEARRRRAVQEHAHG